MNIEIKTADLFLDDALPKQKKGIGGHHSASAKTTTWLTPRDILDPLGKFDLDPCSAPEPHLWPTAETHYTAPKQNGLLLPWFGRVWLNPPYTNSGLMKWMQKMAEHDCGMALLFARVETAVWFKTIWSAASAVLFLDHRPHFLDKNMQRSKTNCGGPIALIGYGKNDGELILDGVLPGAAVPLNRPAMLYMALREDREDKASAATWREVIGDVIRNMGTRTFTLSDVYSALEESPKAAANQNWKAKVRQTIARVGYPRAGRSEYSAMLAA
ncbi:hypothetical protein AA14337_3368 [Acetobacter malorum DSM 14337]|uniref:Adenine methyltransferase n=1 Tax=Acetobacter malorum DSM 14337 TaxID=1307910 RepID=A0ABQ0Q156_9PROT|nr:DNA N-6-adenine-methyltransferase [Acetobacter malorum]GBQ86605.1 hypothetical protein AA14337_3368 [Acetobacter malorum DSM 14337]